MAEAYRGEVSTGWAGLAYGWTGMAGGLGGRAASDHRTARRPDTAAQGGGRRGGRVSRASALVAKPRSSAAGTAGESHGTDKARRDDLPRFFHQHVNNLAGRLDLADQADALARQQTHRIDVSARITVGR